MTPRTALFFSLFALGGCSKPKATAVDPPEAAAPGPTVAAVTSAPAAASAAAPAPLGKEVTLTAEGKAFDLDATGDVPTYCDAKGAHGVDGSVPARACKKDGESRPCGDDVTVRWSQGSNILDLDTGMSFPLDGSMNACSGDKKLIVIATESSVSLIDGKKQTFLDRKSGADHVALGPHWVAWSDGPKVRAKRR